MPNCEFRGGYHIVFLRESLSTISSELAIHIVCKINGQFLKTTLSVISARPGRFAFSAVGTAVYADRFG
jgi:hypothetical protein